MTKRRDRDYTAELVALRAQVAALNAKHEAVSKAPGTLDEAEQRIDSWLDTLTSGLDLGAYRFVAPSAEEEWRPTAHMASEFTMQVGPLVATVARDALRAALVASVRRHLGDCETFGIEERLAKLDDLEAQLLAFERAEEALICEGERLGMALDRRPDADPRAVLELVGEPQAAA